MIKSLYRYLNPKFQSLFLEYPIVFKPRYGEGRPPHPELYAMINAHREDYKKLLGEVVASASQFASIKNQADEKNETLPGWNNQFLPGLDMVMLYTLLKKYNPKTYMEIGSGNSTKMAHFSIQQSQLVTQIISIDPHPRALIDELAHQVIREPFENISPDRLIDLEAGDILFVDNSHRILPNSDSMVFYMEILPRLKPGVIVQIHDVYLPYDYPQFMCDRFYSEQYGLAMYLLANPQRYLPIAPNFFIAEDKELAAILEPLWNQPGMPVVEKHGGSFWFQVVF